jgi:hypothetical protein
MNKLLKYITLLLFAVCVGYQSYGQQVEYRVIPQRRFNNRMNNNQQNAERSVGAVKINFIRNRLHLPPDQAQRFFPLYQEYQQELANIRKLKRQNRLNAVDGTDQINKELFYENEMVQVKMRFNKAFLRILNPDQVSELYKAEGDFNDELVRQLSERRGRPQGPPPGY